MVNEQQITGANYILTFYQEIEALIATYAQYENLTLELETKSGKDGNNLDEDDQQAIKTASQQVRFYIKTTYLRLNSLKKIIKTDEKLLKKITDTEQKTRKTLIVKREDVEEYVILLNEALLENIIKELLQNSTDILKQLSAQ